MTDRQKLSLPAALVALVLTMLVLAGCGSSSEQEPTTTLKVSAAASLQSAFTKYAKTIEDTKVALQFAGSDALAAQIKNGAKVDVFAAANTALPEELHGEGLAEKPTVFATNELVIAVPAGSTEIDSIDDLDESGVKIAAGSETVPVGKYTRKVLGELPSDEQEAILANIKSSEPDVKGVVGKVASGAVDAGFVYQTDVNASDGKLEAVKIDEDLQPTVAYGITVISSSASKDAAQSFIDGLLAPEGQQILKDAGFGPPPS